MKKRERCTELRNEMKKKIYSLVVSYEFISSFVFDALLATLAIANECMCVTQPVCIDLNHLLYYIILYI